MSKPLAIAICVASRLVATRAAYSMAREYSGSTFFDRWNFIDTPDLLNNGDVQYQSRANASTQNLISVNGAGNAILKVDNVTNVPFDIKRNSVRIESSESYGIGSIFMIDLLHLPFGCSVWPSFWTRGTGTGKWPDVGEIDIIEGVNMRTFNQMALHTSPGCVQASGAQQSGRTTQPDCAKDEGRPGCTVQETKKGSYGADFAPMGGGVYAAQFDEAGVYIWFWSRADVPASIKGDSAKTTMDTADWGPPSAAWPASSCNVAQHFTPQQIILQITLCGDFATPTYNDTCPPPKNSCTQDNVFGPGSPTYDNAFFEIPWLRVYSANPATGVTNATSVAPPGSTATPGSSSGASPSNTPGSGGNGSNGAERLLSLSFGSTLLTGFAGLALLMAFL
ncbi:hypothetical protein HGRIS_014272 [Hohenbuehelia grisea]|uniref:GH16 domain-containing protein n=1 Tax=Hohenbuehelia grisea TaxID=104357 RepID=A0ABR3JUV9_9AGAR